MSHRRGRYWLPTLWDLFILVFIFIVGLFMDQPAFKRQAPWLASLQLAAHSLLSRASWGSPYPARVSVIEIDDRSFWSPPLSGVQPTNRAYLADLVNASVKAGARVVGIDFQLKSPTAVPYDDPVRASENRKLIEAILAAGRAHVPVVITTGFVLEGARWKREPNICDDRDRCGLFFKDGRSNPVVLGRPPAPAGGADCRGLTEDSAMAVGYINLPADRREIPLGFVADDFDSTQDRDYFSFALQVASAYESRMDYEARGEGSRAAEGAGEERPFYQAALDAANQNEFVYAGFIPRDAFQKYTVSAAGLEEASQSPVHWVSAVEPAQLRGRIVLIGATWHQWGQGRGPVVDEYSSPAGPLAGVYLHANYIEALLSGRFAPSLSGLYARTIEVVFGYLLIVMMHAWRKMLQRLAIWFAGAVVLAVLAVVLAWRGLYLDFALVALLLLGHVFVEHYENLREQAQSGGH